jgi:hypothetical protein
MRFKSSWKGNWTGNFVAAVSIYQYESKHEADSSTESPTEPVYPYSLNFVPCTNGDHGHCHGDAIAELPAWTDLYTNFMTMPTARYIKIRSYVAGWGAGQWWLDDFKLERVDGELKNVIQTGATDLIVADSSTGKQYTAGVDYTVTPAALSMVGNFSELLPFAVKRVANGNIEKGRQVNISYDFIPGNANQMVGNRDVSCFVEPLYWELMEPVLDYFVRTFDLKWLVPDGFDEQMGMGRDSRTLGSGLTNGQILGQTINRINSMLQHKSKNRTKMVIWADMVVPDHNGGANYRWVRE